jgi:putative MATE family efflux protein
MQSRIASFFGPQDMTVGKPMSNLLRFSVPLLIGNVAQQLYSTVDSIVVSNYTLDGDAALAAIGASGPIINLLLILFMAISTGASVMVSQFFGAKDRESLSATVGTSIFWIIVSSIFITVVGVFSAPYLMTLTNVPPEVYDMAVQYLTIILLGIIGGGFYNIISGILRGMGDSLFPLLFLLVATGLNIALDLLFVIQFHWDVAGVAWATIIAQGVSATLCVLRLWKMGDSVDLTVKRIRPHKPLTRTLFSLGLPAGATQGIFSMAMIIVQSLTNLMGTVVIATSTAVMRVDGFAMLPNFTFGMAATTFVGQNIGARRLDRVQQGSKDAALLSFCISTFLTLMLLLFGKSLVTLFSETALVAELGARMLRILAVGYIAMGFTQVYGGIMRGAGDTMPSMWISIVTTVIMRTPIAYLWAYFTRSEDWPHGHPDALYVSLLIAWVAGALFTYLWYRRGAWKEKARVSLTISSPATGEG